MASKSAPCSCCDPMSYQIKQGWQVAIELADSLMLVLCKTCNRAWHRVHDTESRWKEVCLKTADKIQEEHPTHAVRVFGLPLPQDASVEDDKIVEFPHSSAA